MTCSLRLFSYRRLYMLTTYVSLFFDVIYSLAMSVLRILGPFVFNSVMVFRLDRDLYLRGLEGWDLGKGCSSLIGISI